MSQVCLVLTTLPAAADAEGFARMLVEKRVCACAQILSPGRSLYRWEGTIEQTTEQTLLLKTSASSLEGLLSTITAHHPYEVPEVLVFNADSGFPAYLAWVAQCCAPSHPVCGE